MNLQRNKKTIKNRIAALSLFANVGISEVYYKDIGIDVKIANEIEKVRCDFYSHVFPDVDMVVGDITKQKTKDIIVKKSLKQKIDLVIATPPCQGMSTAGKMEFGDPRNALIRHAVDIIKAIKPKYIFFENVPEQLKTKILINNKQTLIPNYLHKEFDKEYIFNDKSLVNACDYGVPQLRIRAIILLVRKDLKKKWQFPKKENKIVTLRDAIGTLPILDPEISDKSHKDTIKLFPEFEKRKTEALKISKWFYPPSHPYRQIYAMMHTPTGKSAFSNPTKYKPRKINGEIVKGFGNTYKRQEWNRPAFTVTMFNRTIGSQNNVHPGRPYKDKNGQTLYSDPRVLTIYELMIVSSLPHNWNIPSWASDHLIRSVIGEGIPPLLTKKIMQKLVELHNER